MPFFVYQNCTDADFMTFKGQLNRIKSKVTSAFNRLIPEYRHDDSEYLALNFLIQKEGSFLGNLSILFDDSPKKTFSVNIIKTIDLGRKRYFKKAAIKSQCSLDEIERWYREWINDSLTQYDSWSEEDVLSSENVDLDY